MTDWELSDDEIERHFARLPAARRNRLVNAEIAASIDGSGALIASVLKTIGFDRATSVIHRHQSDAAGGNLPPPDLSTVTAAQCSLFDNWGGPVPKKNAGVRYKATFELFKLEQGIRLDQGRNSFWSASAGLFDADELDVEIARLAKGRRMARPWSASSPDDLGGTRLEEFGHGLQNASRKNPTLRFGPVMVSRGNERYPLGVFAVGDGEAIEARKGVQVHLFSGGKDLTFERFDTALSGGAKFGHPNVILHSRTSKRPEDKGWRTCVLP